MTAYTEIAVSSALCWADRVTLARAQSPLADALIQSIRDEAEKLVATLRYDRQINRAIADAAQSLLDAFQESHPDDIADYFDELDALLIDDSGLMALPADNYWRESSYAEDMGLAQ
jgi:hypothetical protein